MPNIIESEYFFMVVSMADILQWDESEMECRPNVYLAKVLECLNVDIDLLALYDNYLNKVMVGRGDVYLYKEQAESDSFIAFDLFKEPSDQLDLINISIRCNSESLPDVRANVRYFFDSCATKISLEESNLSARVIDKVDVNNYPRVIEVSNYRQRLKVYSDQGIKVI